MTDTKIVESEGKKYRINKMRAMKSRKVMYLYEQTRNSKDYEANESLFREMMKEVEVEIAPTQWVRLENDALIDQHTTAKNIPVLEREVLEFAMGFSETGEKS